MSGYSLKLSLSLIFLASLASSTAFGEQSSSSGVTTIGHDAYEVAIHGKTCVCGLDRQLLEQLEALLKTGQSACSAQVSPGQPATGANSTNTPQQQPQPQQQGEAEARPSIAAVTEATTTTTTSNKPSLLDLIGWPPRLPVGWQLVPTGAPSSVSSTESPAASSSSSPSPSSASGQSDDADKDATNTNGPDNSELQDARDVDPTGQGASGSTSGTPGQQLSISPTPNASQPASSILSPTGSDPLVSGNNSNNNGVQTPSSDINSLQPPNDPMAKLNQSQQVNQDDMQSAIESTVPGMVSNLFSSLQNMTQFNNNASQVVSLGGSSIDLEGRPLDQMVQAGENLFAAWIDAYLNSLHLTASVAMKIRRNAIALFGKILKQYIKCIQKLGGNIHVNVSKAIQLALNNTQILTKFFLRNYLNYSAGLMQILGDQVSKMGKRLDSTGDTIAHLTLNPLEIVSEVIESLPNPSDLSKYFRRINKYLLGESLDSTADNGQPQASPSQPNNNNNGAQQQQPAAPQTNKGVIGKTMGSLMSWIG